MQTIYEFFNRPEVLQFCYGLLAALPPALASICSIIVVPMLKKIMRAHLDDLNNKENEIDRKMLELAEAVKNNEIKHAETMTAITKVQREVEEVKKDGKHTT